MIHRPKVVVVGSLNVDLIASVAKLPGAGETISASGLIRRFGGKGANQAVAAARQGASVSMIGCVGTDDDGRAYRQRLKAEGIDATGVSTTAKALTGTALIAVDQHGENLIIVAAGANGFLQPANLRKERKRFENADILLLQQEVPMNAIVEAVRLANRAGVPVIFNPSPLVAGFPWGRCQLDTLIVNSGEAGAIFGMRPSDWPDELSKRGIERLIITRGAKPTLYFTARESGQVPGLKVRPKDTVGAGDAFAGAFAARRAEGMDLRAAIGCANCAGGLTTLQAGAQEAIPSRSETEKACQRLRLHT